MSRTIVKFLFLSVAVAATVLAYYAIGLLEQSVAGRSQRGSTGPTIHEIRSLQHLVTTSVAVTDVLTTSVQGHSGSIEVVLAARAELLIGVDLADAELTEADDSARHAVVTLPAPTLTAVRIDHQRSRIMTIRSFGLWQVLPTDSAIDARVIDAAYAQAERRFQRTEMLPEHRQRSKEHAESILRGFFRRLGWTLELKWRDPPRGQIDRGAGSPLYEWVKQIPVARRVPDGFTGTYRARDKLDARSRNSGLCARVVQSWGRPRIAMDLESGFLSGRPSGPPG